MRIFITFFWELLITSSSIDHAQNGVPQFGRNSVKEVIKAMTLEEKASLVVGTGLRMAGNDAPVIGNADGQVSGAAGNTISIA